MKTPTGQDLGVFIQERKDYLNEQCYAEPTMGALIHDGCGGGISSVVVRLTVTRHTNGELHATPDVLECAIPFCPACESLPEKTGWVYE